MNIALMLVMLLSTVRGQILFEGDAPPPTSFEVGLCEIVPDGTLCSYSVVPPAPKAAMDEDGNFEITGVPPGEYGLVFDFNYFFQVMPWYPDESGVILFTVTDADIDLGVLAYDDWPCDLIPDLRCNQLYLPIVVKE